MANNRIAYGIAKGLGINTDGMSPKEVWEAIGNKKGLTPSKEKKESEKSKTTENEKDYTPEQYKRARDKLRKLAKNIKLINGVIYREAREKEFVKALTAAKASVSEDNRWRVDIHDAADYANDKLFITQGGSCVAVEPNGNIISVCKNKNEKIRGSVLLDIAVVSGGNRLDAFGKGLFKFYTKNGFEPVSWVEWNGEYAPEDWKKAKANGVAIKEEPVIFYKKSDSEYEISYDEFLNKTKASKDYDTAEKQRDKEI